MSVNQVLASQLTVVLKNMLACMKQLHELLTLEQDTLGQEHYADLVQISNKKLALTRQVEQLECDRQALLSNTPSSQSSSQSWLLTAQIRQNWNEIEQLSRQCKEINQVNGAIIEAKRRSVQSRLSILRGEFINNVLYGMKGTPLSDKGTSQSLAQV